MKYVIAPNQVIETVTPGELDHALSKGLRQEFQEMARGIQVVRWDSTATVTAGIIIIPAQGDPKIGPRPGFVWQLAALRVRGLTGSDSADVWRNSAQADSNYLGSVSAAAPVLTFQKHVYLLSGESLLVVGSGLTATGDVTINGEGVSAAEIDLYKLI